MADMRNLPDHYVGATNVSATNEPILLVGLTQEVGLGAWKAATEVTTRTRPSGYGYCPAACSAWPPATRSGRWESGWRPWTRASGTTPPSRRLRSSARTASPDSATEPASTAATW